MTYHHEDKDSAFRGCAVARQYACNAARLEKFSLQLRIPITLIRLGRLKIKDGDLDILEVLVLQLMGLVR